MGAFGWVISKVPGEARRYENLRRAGLQNTARNSTGRAPAQPENGASLIGGRLGPVRQGVMEIAAPGASPSPGARVGGIPELTSGWTNHWGQAITDNAAIAPTVTTSYAGTLDWASKGRGIPRVAVLALDLCISVPRYFPPPCYWTGVCD
jgi:hypothetical protein